MKNNNMKLINLLLLSAVFILNIQRLYSQGVAINTTDATPDSSAMLDVSSTDKGLLLPRMTTNQQLAINSPATGLLIFNTDSLTFWYYEGSKWLELCTCDSIAPSKWNCGDDITDGRDGKIYKTVLIGTQCWMAENLNYGNMVNAMTDPQPQGLGNKYCYNNNTGECNTYGGLYQWATMMNGASSSNSNPSGVSGICPLSWHIPSDAEWCQMENQVEAGTDASCNKTGARGVSTGGKLKEAGTTHWKPYNGCGGICNTSGFTALPGGQSWSTTFWRKWTDGYWWTATECSVSDALDRDLNFSESIVYRESLTKLRGIRVRCIKD